MKITHAQYAQALHEALQESAAKDHAQLIDNFVQILERQGLLHEYEAIINEYERLIHEIDAIAKAEITTAHPMKPSTEMITVLNSLAQKKVAIRTQTDDTIVGGVILKVEDTLVDASVRGNLEKLKKSFHSN